MEILQLIAFYLCVTLCAGIGLPLTLRIFSNRTIAFVVAKPTGLLLFGYAVWLLSSFKLLDYQSRFIITGAFLALVITGLALSRRFFQPAPVDSPPVNPSPSNASASHSSKRKRKNSGKAPVNPKLQAQKVSHQSSAGSVFHSILRWEAVTFFSYVLYLWVRSHNPATNGTERFMDMALLSAAGKTDFFPFIDPWYAGKTVNYYYYGAYLMSLLSNLARLPYSLSYNFSLGFVFSQSVTLATILTRAITASNRAAAAAGFLVTTAGTLFFACATVGSKQVYSYTSSTRLFSPSYLINEIPSYSFTVGDLHAHLLALPFFLLNLILLFELAKAEKPRPPLLALLAVSFASSGMTNAWDLVTLVSLAGTVILLKLVLTLTSVEGPPEMKKRICGWWTLSGLGVLAAMFILMWPSLRAFQSPVLGIGFIPAYLARYNLHASWVRWFPRAQGDVQYPTPIPAFLGLWGVFLAGVLPGLYILRRQLRDQIFLLATVIVALGILLGIEIFFVKDIYSVTNPPYFRANTTFKFGYQTWSLLAIAFVALLLRWNKQLGDKNSRSWRSHFPQGLLILAIVAGLVYPVQALSQFYFSPGIQSKDTLDGSDWMKIATPDDWNTVNYINQNIRHRAVIAEAVGDSYTTHARIATFTGMITPMGWKTHEWTWRFQGKEAERAGPGHQVDTGWNAISRIAEDVHRLYSTASPSEARAICRRYQISYVYVGDLERTAYGAFHDQKFDSIGQLVYQSGRSKLFAIHFR